MKIFIIGLLALGLAPAFADDCTVSISNFDSSHKRIESMLESKGYVIEESNPRYRIHSASSMGAGDVATKDIKVFERGIDEPINSVHKRITWLSVFTGGFGRIEKKFIKSLPECQPDPSFY